MLIAVAWAVELIVVPSMYSPKMKNFRVIAPAVLYLAMQGVWWKTIFLLVWGIVVVGSADNVLRPLLISGRAEIGTVAAFVGAVGGLSTFGLVGLFLGPVIVALAIALVQFAEEARTPAAAAEPRRGDAG